MSADSSKSLLPHNTSKIQEMQKPSAGIMASTAQQNQNQNEHISKLLTTSFQDLNISQPPRDSAQTNATDNLAVSKVPLSSFFIDRGCETNTLGKGPSTAGTHGDSASKDKSQGFQIPNNGTPFTGSGKHLQEGTAEAGADNKRRVEQQAGIEYTNDGDPAWPGRNMCFLERKNNNKNGDESWRMLFITMNLSLVLNLIQARVERGKPGAMF